MSLEVQREKETTATTLLFPTLEFSEESATLHQLAVVEMSAKPRRLEKAEELLREALSVMYTSKRREGVRHSLQFK